jgi:hypothetical protein
VLTMGWVRWLALLALYPLRRGMLFARPGFVSLSGSKIKKKKKSFEEVCASVFPGLVSCTCDHLGSR